MSEEIKVEVKPEEKPSVPVVEERQETITEQAAQIVETAEELAEKMSRSSDDTSAILAAIEMLRVDITNFRVDFEDRHAETMARLAEIETETRRNAEAEMAEAQIEKEAAKEEAQAQVETAVRVAEAVTDAVAPPEKRKRRWL